MICESYKALFAASISGELSPAEALQLETHLRECSACREELAGMQQLWASMDAMPVPEPSARMQADFKTMLSNYKAAATVKKSVSPRYAVAWSLLVALVGLGCGYWLFHTGRDIAQEQQLKDLTAQVYQLKQTMMLALLENPSASERIRGVSYTIGIGHADKEVINALLATLDNDPNVNVRLTALDALAQMTDHPEVRLGLVQSIAQQDSPLVQSAIADLMQKLQEKRSVEFFKQLLKQKDLDPGLKEKIRQTITQLS